MRKLNLNKKVRKSIPYSDFNLMKPNIVQVGKRYANSGNICLGIEKVINGNSKTWRFGKHPMSLNPCTFVDIAGRDYIQLETQAILKYIDRNRWNLKLIETTGFGGMFTKSFLVNIDELVSFCNENSAMKDVA